MSSVYNRKKRIGLAISILSVGTASRIYLFTKSIVIFALLVISIRRLEKVDKNRNPNKPAFALYQNSDVGSWQCSSKACRPGVETAKQLPV